METVVVLGQGLEVPGLAIALARQGASVVVIGRFSSPVSARMHASGVDVRGAATAVCLAELLEGADQVAVVGADDAETRRLAAIVADRAGTRGFPSVAVFDNDAAAQAWSGIGYHAATHGQVRIRAALLRLPPYPGDKAVPPPFVVGSTPLAAKLADAIVRGWQQPGMPPQVHRVVERADAITRRGDSPCPTVDVAAGASAVADVIEDRVHAWRPPPECHATLAGPSVYLVDLAPTTASAITATVLDRLPLARVLHVSAVGPVDDPAALIWTPRDLVAEELFAEASRWPQDIPSLFGALARDAAGQVVPLASQPVSIQRGLFEVADRADDLLRVHGILLSAEEDLVAEHVLLTPEELAVIADELCGVVPRSRGVSRIEHRQRALELAAMLPTVLARSGRRPRRPAGFDDLFAGLAGLAKSVHDQYRMSVAGIGESGHDNAGLGWHELDPFKQQSSLAQVADVPVKLAAVGLTCRRREPATAEPYAFDRETLLMLARLEHRRWEHFERRNGRCDHQLAKPWHQLTWATKELNRAAVQALPRLLLSAGIEIIDPRA